MDTKSAIRALGALAQDTRLAIFRMLIERGPDGLAAGAIAEALDLPPSSLSFHLAQLSHAGLLIQRRESRSLIYSVDFDVMGELMGYLTENCCGGNPAACLPAIRRSTKPLKTRRSA
jgi:DNA-binding transcriptional ArsR family regulator